MGSLPVVNQLCIEVLTAFLRDLSQCYEVTRMTSSNLALIFAVCFLRCPNDSLEDTLVNSSAEQQFTRTLIETYHVATKATEQSPTVVPTQQAQDDEAAETEDEQEKEENAAQGAEENEREETEEEPGMDACEGATTSSDQCKEEDLTCLFNAEK